MNGWRWLGTLAGLLVAGAALGILRADGHFPAELPAGVDRLEHTALLEALSTADLRGETRRERLEPVRAKLELYLRSAAAISPRSRPELFDGPEARIAYWLNTFHALVLWQLLEHGALDWWWRTHPVGGQALTLGAIVRRYLRATEDPRVMLALHTDAADSSPLDGAPFAAELLDAQLNDATRRYFRRRELVRLEGQALHVPRAVQGLEPEILKALPRGHQLLHFVWAYLPDTCEGLYPGCLTRTDLDRACGRALDRCQLDFR